MNKLYVICTLSFIAALTVIFGQGKQSFSQNNSSTALQVLTPVINGKQDTIVGTTNQFDLPGAGVIAIKSGAIITNLVGGAAGSAATPTFQVWDGTGMFKSAEDSIGFTTDGTERWVINASGALNAVGTVDIGNGTADPRYVHAGTSFNIHNQSGIGATIDVLVGGSTTNRLVFVGGILVSNITTFFP